MGFDDVREAELAVNLRDKGTPREAASEVCLRRLEAFRIEPD